MQTNQKGCKIRQKTQKAKIFVAELGIFMKFVTNMAHKMQNWKKFT